MGPLTGRGLGFCAGFGMPGYANPGYGAGFGRGFGRGRGFRKLFSTEKDYLTKQAEVLEDQLQQVKQRLQELDQEPKE